MPILFQNTIQRIWEQIDPLNYTPEDSFSLSTLEHKKDFKQISENSFQGTNFTPKHN